MILLSPPRPPAAGPLGTLDFPVTGVYKGFMTGRFTVLASGSSGNASLLEVGADAWLIDFGLPPHLIGERLSAVGQSWKVVGIFSTGGDAHESELWTDTETAQSAFGRAGVSSVLVSLNNIDAFEKCFPQ